MTMAASRAGFAGVVKIVRFNVQFYAGSALGLLVASALLASRLLPRGLALLLFGCAAALAYWTLSSLAVSWYVYDRAGVMRWKWLSRELPFPPRRWVNIHAGLDESTVTLRQLFPRTEGLVVDIYDAKEMTEASIARARRMYPSTEPFIAGTFAALPLPANDRDTVFLLFAAHELRNRSHRSQLFREAARVLHDTGQVVLVEHLRDWRNFLAFGPGCLHFHSKKDWLHSIGEAGLRVEREGQVTPFVRFFVLRRTGT